ncbi:MAG: ECF RNA polymerase sigma factor SigW [Ignavibacteriaceae bacterium]|nr:ECF RNA polymerase sigma factor SigW [Ignavibacteriaceae bacterium]MCK6614157.1 sigma-70 family RNA polymerase sigma factor [Ignavibacteriaceae bacterium]
MTERNLYSLTDEELILEFQQQETVRAFEILVQRYKNPLTNFVFRYLGDYEATADVVQETFIKVYKNKHTYKTIAKFSTWVYTIAGNLAKTELLKKKRRRIVSINSYGDENETMDLPDSGHTPDTLTDSGIMDTMIQDALMQLNEVYREAVILRDIQELSYEEIAEMLKLEVGTVKSRINRGRARLKELLKELRND